MFEIFWKKGDTASKNAQSKDGSNFLEVFFFFFFSSRRRHTRSLRDWSSDVCSSDLLPPRKVEYTGEFCVAGGTGARSEERRVGKECRCRWSSYDYKKKIKRKNTVEVFRLQQILASVYLVI